MKLVKDVILFFKKLFNREYSTKMIEASVEKEDNTNFINSLKVDIEQKQNEKKVETLICFGDGLGIQDKMTY